MSSPTITEALVDKVLAVDYASLPPAAIDMAKAVTLDGLAVMLAGADEPLGVGRISIQYVREMGGAPQASVIAGGFKTSMLNAAYANGTMAHALDFDNTWYPLNHPTSPTLPAILDKLNAEMVKIINEPDVKERLATLAFTPVGDSRAQFAAFMKSEIAKWGKAVKESGAKAD